MSVSTQDMHEILAEQDAAWNNRPVLRRLYTDWYRLIASNLAHVDGLTVELGSGIGRFKEAEATYRKAIQLRPSDWKGYSMLGIFYIKRSRYADASP